jgi:hypothetical protein
MFPVCLKIERCRAGEKTGASTNALVATRAGQVALRAIGQGVCRVAFRIVG